MEFHYFNRLIKLLRLPISHVKRANVSQTLAWMLVCSNTPAYLFVTLIASLKGVLVYSQMPDRGGPALHASPAIRLHLYFHTTHRCGVEE